MRQLPSGSVQKQQKLHEILITPYVLRTCLTGLPKRNTNLTTLFLRFQFKLDKQRHVLKVSSNFRVKWQHMHLAN